jgi:hypothetical protein
MPPRIDGFVVRLAGALLHAAGCCGCAGPPAVPSPDRAVPVAVAPRPFPGATDDVNLPATISVRVCVHCTGPLVVAPDGRAIAMVYLTITAHAPIDGLRLDALAVTDVGGRVIAGTPRGDLVTSSATPPRPLTTFDGHLAPGDQVELWTTATLEAPDDAIRTSPPIRYELTLAADGGVAADFSGPMEPPGATS